MTGRTWRTIGVRVGYAAMAGWVIVLHVLTWVAGPVAPPEEMAGGPWEQRVEATFQQLQEQVLAGLERGETPERAVASLLARRPALGLVAGMLGLWGLLLGVGTVCAVVGVVQAARGRGPLRVLGPAGRVAWSLWDVGKVVVMVMFLGSWFAVPGLLAAQGVLPAAWGLADGAGAVPRMVWLTAVVDLLTLGLILRIMGRPGARGLGAFRTRPPSQLRSLGLAVAGYVTALPALLGACMVSWWVSQVTGYDPPGHPMAAFLLEERAPGALAIAVLVVVGLGPIAEEVFFRGFVYPAVRNHLGIPHALLVTAAGFAVLHGNWASFLPITVLGLVLGYVYERTGTLVAPVVVHVMHNSGMVLLLVALRRVVG